MDRSCPSVLSLAVLITIVGSQAVAPAEPPASRPASPMTQSAPAPVDPEVERILDRLERRGADIRDIETDLTFIKTDPVLEDTQKFTGTLLFRQDTPNPRFLIRFDRFEQEGAVREKREWHAFDGAWYTEARESTKTIIRRQIVRPGETVEVFRLGQGPFPLPFGQKKAEILAQFHVRLLPATPGDPPETDHLECTPLPGSQMAEKYGTVHFLIDRRLDLPISVRTVEKAEGYEIAASFPPGSIRINRGLPAGALSLPDLPDFQVDTVPLPPPQAQ